MDEKIKAIAIGKDKDPYEIPLNLIQLATYLEYFNSNSKRDLKHIFGLLDLDSSSRRKYENSIAFKSDSKERMKLQIINKALTMELLTSGMFGYIDHPAEVHSNCLVSRYQPQDAVDDKHYLAVPSNYAQGGVPDVQIDYEHYMVILEVSAKYQPSMEDYKKQLSGALKHARSIREKGYDKPVYGILINERSLEHVVNKEMMKEVLKDIKPSEQISITAISIDEFANLGQAMAEKYEDDISKIHSDDLLHVLKATVEKGIYGKFHEIFMERLNTVKSPSHSLWF
ncbi:MAG: hypothetical protein KZQ96_19735 [Candidatus Thiodiazotropha sp. (ex Lucinoma borealis)]|nr:hypothetical protein [Candidatus Thiodiazotropha sp. (ex Lucinoma borealis)]